MDKNYFGIAREMRQALIEAGFGPVDLGQCRVRGEGPPSRRVGWHRLYRWGDVEDWAAARLAARRRRALEPRPSKIDLGPTALGQWIEERGETAHRFAQRLGVRIYYVHRLIRHRNKLWRKALPPGHVIKRVSAETGIPVTTLIADALL